MQNINSTITARKTEITRREEDKETYLLIYEREHTIEKRIAWLVPLRWWLFS
jgi:hypothetical protein